MAVSSLTNGSIKIDSPTGTTVHEEQSCRRQANLCVIGLRGYPPANGLPSFKGNLPKNCHHGGRALVNVQTFGCEGWFELNRLRVINPRRCESIEVDGGGNQIVEGRRARVDMVSRVDVKSDGDLVALRSGILEHRTS